MKRFILTATIAVALLGLSQFANAQSQDDRYNNNNNGNGQYQDNRDNRGDQGQYEEPQNGGDEQGQYEEHGREENNQQQYGYNNEERDQRYNDRQGYNNDGRDDRRYDNQVSLAQGGMNRPDYGSHEMSPVRAQYLRLRQMRRMAMADGYLTYRERMMLAREEDKLDWMRSRYGRF